MITEEKRHFEVFLFALNAVWFSVIEYVVIHCGYMTHLILSRYIAGDCGGYCGRGHGFLCAFHLQFLVRGNVHGSSCPGEKRIYIVLVNHHI